ncbi:putative RNA helicase armi isoform X1 [Rhynchophorus ferrugineus]|uniref:putative RNA helicase armi isoform X1 n=1 Tax=Rhynchophorus ferrugineus TaxID=354439 RepID=UPI003FCD0FCA
MFSYILSFFYRPKPELSLEECVNILTQNDNNEESTANDYNRNNDFHKDDYNFSTTKGIITAKINDKYVIDDLYKFLSEKEEFNVGTTVSFQKLVEGENIVIYNVHEIEKDWELHIEKDSLVTSRIIISKVIERNGREIFLDKDNIKFNLDSVSSEFVPLVGDWIELEVKCEVDKNTLDLSGKVIDIIKIAPLKPHISNGQITYWDANRKTGHINRSIFFNQDSLSCGYIPVVNDKVVAEVIESDQGSYRLRAVKLIPERMKRKIDKEKSRTKVKHFKESHEGLDISCSNVEFTKLGESKEIIVTLTNSSEVTLKLLDVQLGEEYTQLYENEKHVPQDINPQEKIDLSYQCTAKSIGLSNELLLFKFEDFVIGKCINIEVKLPIQYRNQSYINPKVNLNNMLTTNHTVIRGQNEQTIRFKAKNLPDYGIPKKLLNLVITNGNTNNNLVFLEELKNMKKCIFNILSYLNYEDRFHTLLHLDEIANLIHLRQYDQERACFIRNGEFLMLEIENLAERRPSIVLGDKIHALDPSNRATQIFEGNVYKVGAKHVYLKFSEYFHETYNDEDYSIKVVAGRSSYKRQHHAVFLAARHLGRHWLFPSKIDEKQCQTEFWYETYMKNISNGRKKKNAAELKALIELARKNKELEETNKNIRKLEWFNRNLNCKQKDAVVNILKGVCRPLPYIIFGPPGTGKTVTLIETVLQIIRMVPGSRILVTAPSNSAADLLALRLIDSGILKPGDLVRLVSVNYATGENIPSQLIPYCATGSIAREGTIANNISSLNGMRLDCSSSVLGRHRITVSTCSSSGIMHMMDFPKGHFTHIFVDEAGQAGEPEVLIPLTFLDKHNGQAVLAGDPMQLGPIVISKVAQNCGLTESLLERLLDKFPYVRDTQSFPDTEGFDPRLVTKLLYNYRSVSPILNLFSSLFYNGELISTISEEDSKTSGLLQSLSSMLPRTKAGKIPSVVFHGVKGQNFQTPDSPSWYNPHEAAQIFFYINQLYKNGVKAEDIGIITPYTKQVREIRQMIRQADFDVPKVGTVEDFQGQEFEVVLLSTVRSGQEFVVRDLEHGLGFVTSPKRLNVAISRPKSLLMVVGFPQVLGQDVHWRAVINYCIDKGAYVGCPLNNF